MPVFSSSLKMWSSSHIDEIKSSLVYVSTIVLYLLENEWNGEEDWLVIDDMMETLMIPTQERYQAVINEIF